jgi:hypothetical protein
VPHHSRLEISLPVVRIDDLPSVLIACDRVDREIASLEVLLERDIGREARFESAITGTGLAFRPSERVFLFGLRMQEDREVFTDCLETLTREFLRRRAHHDPIALAHWQAE